MLTIVGHFEITRIAHRADDLFACCVRCGETCDSAIDFEYGAAGNTAEYERDVEDCVFVLLMALDGPKIAGCRSSGGRRCGLKMTGRGIEADRNRLSRDRRWGDRFLPCEYDVPRHKLQ